MDPLWGKRPIGSVASSGVLSERLTSTLSRFMAWGRAHSEERCALGLTRSSWLSCHRYSARVAALRHAVRLDTVT